MTSAIDSPLTCSVRWVTQCFVGWLILGLALLAMATNALAQSDAEESELAYHVDSPLVTTWRKPDIEIGGWVWIGMDDPIARVEVESGDWSYPMDFGLDRGDVAAYLGVAEANKTGFHARVTLPASVRPNSQLVIAAYRSSGEKIVLKKIRYRPVRLSQQWRPWLAKHPEWLEDPFWFVVGTSGISQRGDQGFSDVYRPYKSDTFRLGLRVPILYMRATRGAAEDWRFDPSLGPIPIHTGFFLVDDWLDAVIKMSVDQQVPILFTLNGGVWGDANGSVPEFDLTDHLELDPMNCQWDQDDNVFPDDLIAGLPGSLMSPELSRTLTLNAYNETVRFYKKRNLQLAGTRVVTFAEEHPHLFAGVNLDPDVYMSPFVRGSWHDFNPDTLRQFRDWLSGGGLYASGALLEDYPSPALTLSEINEISEQNFSRWEEVEPPRDMPRQFLPGPSEPWMFLWERFRRHLVDLHYDDLSRWLVETGLDPAKIFSSQGFMAPRKPSMPFSERLDSDMKNFDSAGMTIEGAIPTPGHLGVIVYGKSALNDIATESGRSLFSIFYEADPDWGIVEHNTADFRDPPGLLPSYEDGYRSLLQLFNHHARLLSPMAWNGSNGDYADDPGFHAHAAYLNTPLENAVTDFLSEYAYLPRNALYWPFGNEGHPSVDGWQGDEAGSILWAEGGVLRWRHPASELSLVSPDALAMDVTQHTTLVIGLDSQAVTGIAIDFQSAADSPSQWRSLVPIRALDALDQTEAGVAIPLPWPGEGDPSRIRIRLQTDTVGESRIRHIAILPTR